LLMLVHQSGLAAGYIKEYTYLVYVINLFMYEVLHVVDLVTLTIYY